MHAVKEIGGAIACKEHFLVLTFHVPGFQIVIF